jgi:hypothetical protein
VFRFNVVTTEEAGGNKNGIAPGKQPPAGKILRKQMLHNAGIVVDEVTGLHPS